MRKFCYGRNLVIDRRSKAFTNLLSHENLSSCKLNKIRSENGGSDKNFHSFKKKPKREKKTF